MNMLKLIIPLVMCVTAPALWAVQYDLSWNKVSGGGATFMTGGNFSLGGTTGQHEAGPLVRSNYELNGGFWATTNHPLLTLLSSASAAPNPAVINTTVQFFVAVNIPAATITWDFGDGSVVATGAQVTHSYTATGMFTAVLSIVDVASGQMYTQNLPISIGTATDVDSDGFITELETALGTDPLNINSTPFGGAPAGVPQPIVISKVSVKLNFTKAGTDSISLSGLLPIPMGFSIAGKTAVVYLGGVTKSFTLNAKGTSPKANDSFGIKIKAVKGVVPAQSAPFATKFLKGSFSAALADEGLDGSATVKNVARDVNVIVLFNQTLFTTKKTLTYTATKAKVGSAK
ncbi:MAG: PKD domain-containing protein [Planctomycetota bacterium]